MNIGMNYVFKVFQSTHPREGVRPQSGGFDRLRRNYFNPRTPAKECDWKRDELTGKNDTFQSTHPREGVRPQHIANRELHLLHIGCQTAEKATVSVIFE